MFVVSMFIVHRSSIDIVYLLGLRLETRDKNYNKKHEEDRMEQRLKTDLNLWQTSEKTCTQGEFTLSVRHIQTTTTKNNL